MHPQRWETGDEWQGLRHCVPKLVSILKDLHHSATVTVCPHPTSSAHGKEQPQLVSSSVASSPHTHEMQTGWGTWIWGQLTHSSPSDKHIEHFCQGCPTMTYIFRAWKQMAWGCPKTLQLKRSSIIHLCFHTNYPMLSQQKPSLAQWKLRFSLIDPSSWSCRHLSPQIHLHSAFQQHTGSAVPFSFLFLNLNHSLCISSTQK